MPSNWWPRSRSGWATARSRRSSSIASINACSPGLRRSDLAQTLGDAFVCAIPNDYNLVREAIDRGVPLDEVKPGNKITAQIRKLMLGNAADKAAEPKSVPLLQKHKLSIAK